MYRNVSHKFSYYGTMGGKVSVGRHLMVKRFHFELKFYAVLACHGMVFHLRGWKLFLKILYTNIIKS